jgi:heptosyltransferase-2
LSKRILAIRLQAMGDMVITLPYLQALRNDLPPGTVIDLLTRKEVEQIPKGIELFNHVYSIGGGRSFRKQLFFTCLMLPRLFFRRYDVVLDLQNNNLSHLVRRSLFPKSWSEFERRAQIPAGDCTKKAIADAGINIEPSWKFTLKKEQNASELLKESGWDGKSRLVLLNPAGAFMDRKWPGENYEGFAALWTERFAGTQFLIMGVDKISEKANYLKERLGERLVNMVGKTSPLQAFAIVQQLYFVLSEDSGLMHMAWVSGVPTLALFGGAKNIRTQPLGDHSGFLYAYDILNLSPKVVFEKAVEMLKL